MTQDLLAYPFVLTHHVLHKNLEGVGNEESLQSPPGGGSSLNWVLGHILASRNGLVKLLEQEPFWEDDSRTIYVRGSEGLTTADARPLTDLLADLDRSQGLILPALKSFPADRLPEKAPWSPTGNERETMGSLLTGLAFHESYHTGQTGTLRRALGKPGAIA